MHPRISDRVRELALAIYWGNDRAPEPNAPPRDARSFHADESGKITLISTVTMLFFLVLVCYVGNAGVAVKEKMELQDAADAAAFTTSLVQARGMNAITTANHMIGEATALVVILDGFGGKILEETKGVGTPYNSNESKLLSYFIKYPLPVRQLAPCEYIPLDSQLVELACKILVPEMAPFKRGNESEGDHWAGATFFDANLSLKYTLGLSLTIKAVCTVLMRITAAIPVVGQVVMVAGIGTHLFISTIVIRAVVTEAVILEALEGVMITLQPMKIAVKTILIPGLSAYSDSVVSFSPLASNATVDRRTSAVARSAKAHITSLNQSYASRGIKLVTHPAAGSVTLPVIKEQPPAGGGSMPPSQWESPFEKPTAIEALEGAFGAIKDVIDTVKDILGAIVDILSFFGGGGIFEEALDKLNDQLNIPEPPFKPDLRNGYKENPCHHSSSKYRLPESNWETERTSQYVRATFPYVHSMRGPIYNWMMDMLPFSYSGIYFVHWTNRYTLATAHNLRISSGLVQPHMYLMKDSRPDIKGNEPWVQNEEQASRMFPVFAFATREPRRPIFGPGVFSKPTTRKPLMIASAMFYNANGRNLAQGVTGAQPNTGWDTLNWFPAVTAPEWGGHQPDKRDNDPWAVFGGTLPATDNSRVQINWQAKLIPILADGRVNLQLREASIRPGTDVPAEIRTQLREMLSHQELIHQ